MSKLFKPIEGSAVTICRRGIYYQTKVFERGGELYAKYGSGYIRLMKTGWTSHGDVKWTDVDLPVDMLFEFLRLLSGDSFSTCNNCSSSGWWS